MYDIKWVRMKTTKRLLVEKVCASGGKPFCGHLLHNNCASTVQTADIYARNRHRHPWQKRRPVKPHDVTRLRKSQGKKEWHTQESKPTIQLYLGNFRTRLVGFMYLNILQLASITGTSEHPVNIQRMSLLPATFLDSGKIHEVFGWKHVFSEIHRKFHPLHFSLKKPQFLTPTPL